MRRANYGHSVTIMESFCASPLRNADTAGQRVRSDMELLLVTVILGNLMHATTKLDEYIGTDRDNFDTIFVIDADRTLAAVDTGNLS